MKNIKISPSLLFTAYTIGALCSLALALVATWSDLEAAFYGFDRRGSMPLQELRCPTLMNRTETGIVSVQVRNTTDRRLSPSVKAEFSTRQVLASTLDSIRLEPGEARKLTWTIGPENIDLGRFIFAKVLIFATYPLPDQEGVCGVFIIDLPVRGNVVLIVLLAIGAIGMGGGLYLLDRSRPLLPRMERALRPLTFLAIVIAVALAVSLMGWWVQALLLLTVVLLTIVVSLGYIFVR